MGWCTALHWWKRSKPSLDGQQQREYFLFAQEQTLQRSMQCKQKDGMHLKKDGMEVRGWVGISWISQLQHSWDGSLTVSCQIKCYFPLFWFFSSGTSKLTNCGSWNLIKRRLQKMFWIFKDQQKSWNLKLTVYSVCAWFFFWKSLQLNSWFRFLLMMFKLYFFNK